MRHLVRPFFLPENVPGHSTTPKLIYDFLSWFTVQSLINYTVAAFFLLGWKDSLIGWSRLGWYGHVLLIGGWLSMKFGAADFLKKINAQHGRDASGRQKKAA